MGVLRRKKIESGGGSEIEQTGPIRRRLQVAIGGRLQRGAGHGLPRTVRSLYQRDGEVGISTEYEQAIRQLRDAARAHKDREGASRCGFCQFKPVARFFQQAMAFEHANLAAQSAMGER